MKVDTNDQKNIAKYIAMLIKEANNRLNEVALLAKEYQLNFTFESPAVYGRDCYFIGKPLLEGEENYYQTEYIGWHTSNEECD
jgi:hypothetical protein